jgi:hypothetical protein
VARLIEIRPSVQPAPATLTVYADDLLTFAATGGRVTSGAASIEIIGIFRTSVLAGDGRILSPAGAPDAVLFRAGRPGPATIEVVIGDPWRSPRTVRLEVLVEPAPTAAR